ncbi:hypothetical protein [Achromobacter animicus]|uniref:hypothetical protein n=1 Tax=Achromobacter animicus TaxID=1389935 RepID=UPI0028A5DB8A|nr:hypothetical protein [Achromobacter animicus]
MKKLLSFLERLLFKPERTPDPRPEILEIVYSLRHEPYVWRQKGPTLVRDLETWVVVRHDGVSIGRKDLTQTLTADESRELSAALQHWEAYASRRLTNIEEIRDGEWRAAHAHLPKLRGAKH